MAAAREEKWSEKKYPEWTERFRPFGDIRVRFEGDYFPERQRQHRRLPQLQRHQHRLALRRLSGNPNFAPQYNVDRGPRAHPPARPLRHRHHVGRRLQRRHPHRHRRQQLAHLHQPDPRRQRRQLLQIRHLARPRLPQLRRRPRRRPGTHLPRRPLRQSLLLHRHPLGQRPRLRRPRPARES